MGQVGSAYSVQLGLELGLSLAIIDVVAPWKTIEMNPNYLGRWMSEDLQHQICERNNERERLKRKGGERNK